MLRTRKCVFRRGIRSDGRKQIFKDFLLCRRIPTQFESETIKRILYCVFFHRGFFRERWRVPVYMSVYCKLLVKNEAIKFIYLMLWHWARDKIYISNNHIITIYFIMTARSVAMVHGKLTCKRYFFLLTSFRKHAYQMTIIQWNAVIRLFGYYLYFVTCLHWRRWVSVNLNYVYG